MASTHATRTCFRCLQTQSRRSNFTSSARSNGASFFNLGARAASRENYHISKQSGIPHTESSASLQLLRAERDLAERRENKSLAKKHKKVTQKVPSFSSLSQAGHLRPPAATLPVARSGITTDPRVDELTRTVDSYKQKLLHQRKDFEEMYRVATRRNLIWKILTPVAFGLCLFGVSDGYKWRIACTQLEEDMVRTRSELTATKRERDTFIDAWQDSILRETYEPKQPEREETARWQLRNLLWR